MVPWLYRARALASSAIGFTIFAAGVGYLFVGPSAAGGVFAVTLGVLIVCLGPILWANTVRSSTVSSPDGSMRGKWFASPTWYGIAIVTQVLGGGVQFLLGASRFGVTSLVMGAGVGAIAFVRIMYRGRL